MIIDTHTHFYDPSRPQGVPWPPEDNELLYRTVLPEHLRALAKPLGIGGTVVVEASEWPEDNQWILDLAEQEPFIVGFVGHIDPLADGFARSLDRFAANPLFRGIRTRGVDLKALTVGTGLRNVQLLAETDLSLDVLAGPGNLEELTVLAGKARDLRIIINHVGHVVIDGQEPDPVWQEGMRRAADNPLVCCKVSRLTEAAISYPAPEDPAFYEPTLDFLFRTFGEDRLIYGSNWPVSDLAADYATGFNVVAAYFESKGESTTEKVFSENAKAAYKWLER
jgi:L-fuconolactonase